jgi:large subunit ribosomal protein L21
MAFIMYAILETGGKQYKVQPGDVIEVERLDGEVGSQVELGRVLMLAADDQAPKFGNPGVEGVKVFGEVVEQGKGEKLIIFKYKPKVRYRRKTGHRQSVTRVRVGDIVGPE